MRLNPFLAALAALAAGLLPTGSARAQASFHENFEDIGAPSYSTPASLTSRGWIFRNQSQPLGTRGYFSGITPSVNPIYFSAQGGQRYLAVDAGATHEAAGGTISAWAILPPIPNQQAGDEVSLWARRLSGVCGFEVRYSPSGGTSTGTTASSVGDFTQVLFTVSDVNPSGWARYAGTVPGAGRIAIRSSGIYGGVGSATRYLGLDSLSVGPPPPPACNMPPLPAPGQIAMWGPGSYRICENVTIPSGATVNVLPGTVINVDAGRQLNITGTLNADGTAAAPVRFSAPGSYPPYIIVSNGTLNATATIFNQSMEIQNGGSNAIFTDCEFQGSGTLLSGANFKAVGGYIRFDGSTFTNSYCFTQDAIVVLKDCYFDNTQNGFWYGVIDFLGNNVFEGQPLGVLRQRSYQPLQIANVHATGVDDDAGIVVTNEHILLGPNVITQGNKFPIKIDGDLLPGSTLPVTGNLHNAIDMDIGVVRTNSRWIDLGIPYRVTVPNNPVDPLFGADIIVDPGVTIEHDPGCFLVGKYQNLQFMGLPDRPITLKPTVPGQRHTGPWFGGAPAPHMEYVIAEGMQDGVTANSTIPVWVENCIFRDNDNALQAWGASQMRVSKTRFLGNGTGTVGNIVLYQPDMPRNYNAFEGNGIAVEGPFDSFIDATRNWWGSPTGPRHPQNPSGTGDRVGGEPLNVDVLPFLTQRPDFGNHPPVVRINLTTDMRPNQMPYSANSLPILQPGTKYILNWQASDDDAIVSQNIVLVLNGFGDAIPLADRLPGTQRSLEFTVPSVGFQQLIPHQLRITATDTRGQIGWDRAFINIPSEEYDGTAVLHDEPYRGGRIIRPGETFPSVSATTTGFEPWQDFRYYILFESDYQAIGDTWHGQFFELAPHISTDRARIAMRAYNNYNRYQWFYSPYYFSVRHDPRLGWEPPVVSMTAPAAGQTFTGGGVIPIRWTASAQQGLYGFDIQVSYDGGNVWHALAYNLPSAARAYDWKLPASNGIDDLRIRVIAKDVKFQNSAAGDDRAFTVRPGRTPIQPGRVAEAMRK